MGVAGKNTLGGKQLLSYVERIEAKNKQIQSLQADKAAIKAEAKAAGLLPKGLDLVVKARALKPSQFREDEDLRDLYLHAAGLADEPPLFRYLETLARDTMGREELIKRMAELVPAGASITVAVGEGLPVRISRDKSGKLSSEEVKPEPQVALTSGKKAKGADAGAAPAPVPDVDEDGAERLGRQAARDDKPIIDNPFPFGDKRRPRFDLGWRKETGADGMGPEEEPGDE